MNQKKISELPILKNLMFILCQLIVMIIEDSLQIFDQDSSARLGPELVQKMAKNGRAPYHHFLRLACEGRSSHFYFSTIRTVSLIRFLRKSESNSFTKLDTFCLQTCHQT